MTILFLWSWGRIVVADNVADIVICRDAQTTVEKSTNYYRPEKQSECNTVIFRFYF